MKQFVVGMACLLGALASNASEFPSSPIRLITPTAPGGAMDSVARLLADRLSPRLGQPVVIDYKPGAGGTLGTSSAAKAKPDGHTLVIVADSYLTVAPRLLKGVTLNPQRDLAPVIEIGSSPMVLVAHPSLGVNSVSDLVKRAKAMPDRITYASGGAGSPHHLFMGTLEQLADIRLSHVPYRGGPQAYADVLAGHVSAMFIAMRTAEQHLRNGQLVPLGISSENRSADFPSVPAVGETITGYDNEFWFAIFAPMGTPREVLNRLNRELAAILDEPESARFLKALGFVPSTQRSADALAAKLEREDARMANLIIRLKLTAE